MHFKTKSLLKAVVLLSVMIIIAVAVINIHTGGITGRVINCECEEDADCDDSNSCTEDICLYPENCAASRCLHQKIC